MSYVYICSGRDEWSVGFYHPDNTFISESEHDSPVSAARRVNYLNGGTPDNNIVVQQAFSYSQKFRKTLEAQP
jgi:hypothetical protein